MPSITAPPSITQTENNSHSSEVSGTLYFNSAAVFLWQKTLFVVAADKDGEEEKGGKGINVNAFLPQCRFRIEQPGIGGEDFLFGPADPNFD